MKSLSKIILTSISIFTLVAADNFPKAPSEIVAESPQNAWIRIHADDLVIAKLANGKSFIFQLAPEFASQHVANIKALVRAGWFDNAAINRVQDNYVVQWGAPEGTALPANINPKPNAEYEFPLRGKNFKALRYRDAYAQRSGYINSWPIATNNNAAWLVHCYGMIGVGRDMAPDTGNGGELYTVIGHGPRHLDRNITTAGRILTGIENLTSLPRGTGALGFYEQENQKIQFDKVQIVSDLPINEQPKFEVLDQNSPTFTSWINARANRGGPFFILPAGAVDICNAQIPIRQIN